MSLLQTSPKLVRYEERKTNAPRPGDLILDPADRARRIEISRVLGREGELWRVSTSAGDLHVGPGFTRRVWIRRAS